MPRRVVVVGGGAAGFFAAITCAEANPRVEVVLLEKGPRFLSKVRISGGGRCNVTHACFDPQAFSTRFPRGDQALIGPFHRFQAGDTAAWFESRGVALKTEADGRMFPVTDSSQTIVDCLVRAAENASVRMRTGVGVERAARRTEGGFELGVSNGERIECDRVLLATGGCRTASLGRLAVALGHSLVEPVPSLFTFHVALPWLRELAGVSVDPVEVWVPGTRLRERGPLLVTHWGLSGPSILRLSAWGAKELHQANYQFNLRLNWLPLLGPEGLKATLQRHRREQGGRLVVNGPIPPLASRLWEQLVLACGLSRETRWAALPRAGEHALLCQLGDTELAVTGKTLNKDEFVTCGGVRLDEVDFKTMQSRLCPGLFLAGELLDIDGITGGFNFQAAWTTGWTAGHAMARD